MLKITKRFLIKAHQALDELGYHPVDGHLVLSELKKSLVYILNRTQTAYDASDAIEMYYFLVNKSKKIEKLIKKYPVFWDSIPYEGTELLSLFDDDWAMNTLFITNALGKNYTDIRFSGAFLEDSTLLKLKIVDNMFCFADGDEVMFLRYSKMSSSKMIILDKNKEKLVIVRFNDKDCSISLENNKTNYTLIDNTEGSGFYLFPKDCKKPYNKEGNPDIEKASAFIQWDAIAKESDLGVARIYLLNKNVDVGLLLLISASCFLLYKSRLDANSGLRTVLMLGIASKVLRKS